MVVPLSHWCGEHEGIHHSATGHNGRLLLEQFATWWVYTAGNFLVIVIFSIGETGILMIPAVSFSHNSTNLIQLHFVLCLFYVCGSCGPHFLHMDQPILLVYFCIS